MAYSTEDFFPVFKEECGKWLDFFNLKNWKVRTTLEKVVTPQEDGSSFVDQNLLESKAICSSNRVGKVADIVLNQYWNYEPDEYEVRKCAFHEVCELFLARAGSIAFDPKASDLDWEEEVHSIIRTLENSVFANSTTTD